MSIGDPGVARYALTPGGATREEVFELLDRIRRIPEEEWRSLVKLLSGDVPFGCIDCDKVGSHHVKHVMFALNGATAGRK